MGLLTLLPRLPFLPLTGTLKLGEIIAEEADRQLHDPARIRRELEDAQQRHAAGEITDEELAQIEDQVTQLLVPGAPAKAGPADDDGS
ncbi:MAG: gas vesicle protein GvpG [Candidatus Dormibacteraeota bacterium]|nr:gas vesicle protein GvpG [Candidatus Dormibacteraeota bacterium]